MKQKPRKGFLIVANKGLFGYESPDTGIQWENVHRLGDGVPVGVQANGTSKNRWSRACREIDI